MKLTDIRLEMIRCKPFVLLNKQYIYEHIYARKHLETIMMIYYILIVLPMVLKTRFTG